jgi:hypothetical protein
LRVLRHTSGAHSVRRQKWKRHFRWKGSVLVGRTAIGRATIAVLKINHPDRIQLRESLMEEGVFPPLIDVE